MTKKGDNGEDVDVQAVNGSSTETKPLLPKVVVFDLDYTLWPLWVDTHVSPPLKRPASAINLVKDRSGRPLGFYPDVPSILFRLRREGVYVAAASRTQAPNVARQALSGLHIYDAASGQTDADAVPAASLFAQLEIYPGTKTRHLRAIAAGSGAGFRDVLFFDDELRNAEVEGKLGVKFWQVPWGLDQQCFEEGVRAWRTARGEE